MRPLLGCPSDRGRWVLGDSGPTPITGVSGQLRRSRRARTKAEGFRSESVSSSDSVEALVLMEISRIDARANAVALFAQVRLSE